MNYLDIIIVAVVSFFVARGINKGLIKTVSGVAGFFLALVVATGMMGRLADLLQLFLGLNKGASYILGFILIFFGVLIIVKIVAALVLTLFTVTSLRWVDRAGGGVCGFFIGGLILSSVLVALSFFSFTEKLLPERDNSVLYPYAKNFFPAVYNTVIKIKPAAKTFQEISEEILEGQPVEALKKSQAGRELLKYWEKLKKKNRKTDDRKSRHTTAGRKTLARLTEPPARRNPSSGGFPGR